MKKVFLLLFVTAAIITQTSAQTPTWSADVATIIYSNCSDCHHTGGIGPFTLMSYQDVYDTAISVETQIQAKLMPPWKPDPNYCHFQGERSLSAAEITTISDWIDGGAPRGDSLTEPAPPVFTSTSQLPVIDQTLQLPAWTVTTSVDQYRSFVIPAGVSAGQFLNQIEYQPGNGAIVHHIVLWADPTSISQNLDDVDPLPGFESNGTMPASFAAVLLGAWAPGSGVFHLPSNMGIKIAPNYDYVVEIHYAPGVLGQTDSTKINLKFTNSTSGIRQVYVNAVLQYFDGMTDGPLFIPANTVKTFHEEYTLSGASVSLVGVFPHMHKVGSSFKSWSLSTSGDTTHLIDIPHWSFHWQGFYNYQKLIPVFDGSQIWAEASYDNTVNNPDNPNNPPLDVAAGEHTTDEMMIGFFAYVGYFPGDENVILDSSLVNITEIPTTFLVQVFPNPTTDEATVEMKLTTVDDVQFDLFNASGLLMKSWTESNHNTGFNSSTFSMKGFSPGMYVLKVSSKYQNGVTKIMKQ